MCSEYLFQQLPVTIYGMLLSPFNASSHKEIECEKQDCECPFAHSYVMCVNNSGTELVSENDI
jgi:hypothetical protein